MRRSRIKYSFEFFHWHDLIIHIPLASCACSSPLFIHSPLVYHLPVSLFPTFVVHLFSIYSSFHLYTCPPFVSNLFSLHIHSFSFLRLFFHPSSFILHPFSISFLIYFPFVFHLSSIYFSFIFSISFLPAFISPKPNDAVRARSRHKYRSVAGGIDFSPLEISSKPTTNGCQGET